MNEQIRKDLDRRWQTLTIANDFLFCKVMQNPELCRQMLERILSIHVDEIRFPDVQKTIEAGLDSHGIRLDLYTDDGKTIYNVEMQTVMQRDLPRRSRYYGSLIDVQELNHGVYYSHLKNRIVIFICLFDPFGEGRHRYTFRMQCWEIPCLNLNDGTTAVFLNCLSTMDDVNAALRSFLDYIAAGDVTDPFSELINEEVLRAKQKASWRNEYMTLEMRDIENRELGKEEGREEGQAQERSRFSALLKRLRADGRTEDINRCIDDPSCNDQLYKEYGL